MLTIYMLIGFLILLVLVVLQKVTELEIAIRASTYREETIGAIQRLFVREDDC